MKVILRHPDESGRGEGVDLGEVSLDGVPALVDKILYSTTWYRDNTYRVVSYQITVEATDETYLEFVTAWEAT